MSSPYRNPERLVAATQLRLITLATLLTAFANNAFAQGNTVPNVDSGPNGVAVTSLFPNGSGPPPLDQIGQRFEENKAAIADGKVLFGQMNCTGCHFNGGGGMGPALMSGNWRYGGQMDQIYASIAQGRPNGMPSWQLILLPTQIWELAAYVKSLSAPASTSKTTAPETSAKP